MKKLVSILVILGLAGGGLFYWWQNQADVRALNKTLPEGVRVEKSLFGEEYKVVNKIDGYEFKVPKEWDGIEEVAYDSAKTEQGYTASSLGMEGNKNNFKFAGIDRYVTYDSSINLISWSQENFKNFGLTGNFSEDSVGELNTVKTQENVNLGGMWVYFFQKNSAVYAITNGSEEFIKYIIANGQW